MKWEGREREKQRRRSEPLVGPVYVWKLGK